MSRTQLRGYQVEAVKAVVTGFRTGDRSQVIAACGTGKTWIAVDVARRVCPAGGLVVVACPSLALLAQTVAVWAGERKRDRILAVCGDPTVGDAPVRAGDLPCAVTRDASEIAAWLTGPGRGRRLIATTHRSSDVVGAGLALAKVRADLLVVDEAHRTAGRSGKHTALLHRDDGLAADRRLYLTATPRYLASGGAKAGDEALVGMDNPGIFGPVHYKYPFGKAIADGWLDDYQIAVIGVSQPEALETLRGIEDDVTLGTGEVPLRMAVVQAALARAMKEWDLRRVIAFTPRVEQARTFARTLPTTLRALRGGRKLAVTSRFVHGGMSVAQRDAVLDDLRKPPNDGATVVANARCLVEGVDVPAVDGVLFTRPSKSVVDVIQAVGRALRRNPGGSGVATVIVPVLLPDSPGEDADMGDDGYATLWQVVRALRAHDETLSAELDRRRRTFPSAGTARDPGLPARIVVRLSDGAKANDYLRHVSVRLVEQTTSQWLASFAAAEKYQQTHGDLQAPRKAKYEGVALGSWLDDQRWAYRTGMLLPERVMMLEQLGMVWDPTLQRWQAGLRAAEQFHREHGHLRVKQGFRIDGIELFRWLNAQRDAYRADALAADRVAALNRLGMVWNVQDQRWQTFFAALCEFHREHGHLDVPTGIVVEGLDLRSWLGRNRRAHNHGTLSAERAKLLNDLGMVWDFYEQQWLAGLQAAERYHRDHGNLQVPRGTRVNGISLDVWINDRRRQRREGKLPRDRVRALNKLGMVWTTRKGRS